MEFSIKQTEALDILEDNETNELLFGGQAGGGKSIVFTYFGAKQCMKYPGVRGLIGRYTLKTLRETTLVSFFKVCKMQGLLRDRHYRYVAPSNIIFKNGSEILLKDLGYYPSDPEFDELGSLEITFALIDEANQITLKAKNVVRSRIRHMLDEYGLIPKMGMSCNPAKNWTKTQFYTPFIKGTLAKGRRFVPASVHENPYISKHYVESLQQLDKATKARLLDGNWDYNDDPSMLMTGESIAAIFDNYFVKAEGKKYITCDVARMGKDATIIRVWHGWRVIRRVELNKKRTTEVAAEISKLMAFYEIPKHQVLCDENGVGGGVIDILGCKGFIANAKPLPGPPRFKGDNYNMLRSQCAFYLAEQVNNSKVYEMCEEDVREKLVAQLEQLKNTGFDKDKKQSVSSTDKIKEAIQVSPDDMVTYILRAWFDLSQVGGYNIVDSEPRDYTASTRMMDSL